MGNGLEDVTNLVCLEAFHEASRNLEEAHLKCRQAALDLANVHKKLEQALDHAFREQSFSRLDHLITKEEVALAPYEQEYAKLTKAAE